MVRRPLTPSLPSPEQKERLIKSLRDAHSLLCSTTAGYGYQSPIHKAGRDLSDAMFAFGEALTGDPHLFAARAPTISHLMRPRDQDGST